MADHSLPLLPADRPGPKGRGCAENPPNRFESAYLANDPDSDEEPTLNASTQILTDHAKTVIRRNNSPDLGFEYSINVYRGCEHGCIYCYARPTHETLGYSAGLDFETKILVKSRAAEILREELMHPRWRGDMITMSSVTDCYQPLEKRLGITRQCLAVLADFCNPLTVITKNFLVTRDMDLLARMSQAGAARVYISMTTLRKELTAVMEPRTSAPQRRLDAIHQLSVAGVSVGVLVAPVIPGLTDFEIADIVHAAAAAGAQFADMTPVRLPYGLKDMFTTWLERNFPDRASKVLARIRDIRGGKLNDSNFYSRMTGQGEFADQIHGLFRMACRKSGFSDGPPAFRPDTFQRPAALCKPMVQGELF